MNPKKPKHVIKRTAEQLEMTEEAVDKIVNAYYKQVRQKLSSPEHLFVYLHNLGYFKIKATPLIKAKHKLNSRIKRIEAKGEISENYKLSLEENKELVEKFQKLYEQYHEERSKKSAAKTERDKILGKPDNFRGYKYSFQDRDDRESSKKENGDM